MKSRSGLDILVERKFDILRQQRIGLLCHQASVSRRFRHLLDLLLPLHRRGELMIQAVFGPQHGLGGYTQDNMVEWQGYTDRRTGLPIYSLYGEYRAPTPAMLQGLQQVIIDLQDVGSRYYTFIWSAALMMEACAKQGLPVVILDRPNPISGEQPEGTLLDMEYRSFVGLYPLPQRHGMTLGEIALYLKEVYFPELTLQVIRMQGWKRQFYFPQTGLPWMIPSPNMPGWETALVYPGMCLLEGTNLSEGRGTTRPFQIFGAAWIDGYRLCQKLNRSRLPGVYFRPIQFKPTFHKYQGELCEGGFIHVTHAVKFKPVISAIAVLRAVFRLYPDRFRWKNPPYEYESQKMPFDILAGNSWLREMISSDATLDHIEARMRAELMAFSEIRQKYLQY